MRIATPARRDDVRVDRRVTAIGRIALSAWLLAAAGCSAIPVDRVPRQLPHRATFIVVRHAEKTGDDPRDPGLSTAGVTRARALAARFADRDIMAVYATAYRRTRDTAAPTAAVHHLVVETYDAASSAADVVDMLRRTHTFGTVLVVGHSNTVPAIVSALCACAIAPMDDDAYDHVYDVRIDASGARFLRESRD